MTEVTTPQSQTELESAFRDLHLLSPMNQLIRVVQYRYKDIPVYEGKPPEPRDGRHVKTYGMAPQYGESTKSVAGEVLFVLHEVVPKLRTVHEIWLRLCLRDDKHPSDLFFMYLVYQ